MKQLILKLAIATLIIGSPLWAGQSGASTYNGVVTIQKYNAQGLYQPRVGITLSDGSFKVINNESKGANLLLIGDALESHEISVTGLAKGGENVTVTEYHIPEIATERIESLVLWAEYETGE
ncbi:MAG: hypothetical protein OCD01_10140 [Fibrobacterales bacterium]